MEIFPFEVNELRNKMAKLHTKPKKDQSEKTDAVVDINQNNGDQPKKESSPKKKAGAAKKNGVQKAKKTGE